MPRTLPPYAATYLGRFPDAQARFDFVASMAESLAAEQRAKLASETKAREDVQELQAQLARLTQEKERDPAAEKRLASRIKLGQDVHQTGGRATVEATTVSHGTRVVVERVASMIEGSLAGENADLEMASRPKLPKGKTPLDVVASQRLALAAVHEEVEEDQSALPPKAETLALAMGALDAEVARGRVRVTSRGRIVWPEVPLPVLPIAGSDLVKTIDTVALVASLHADALKVAVEQAVDALYIGVPEERQLTSQEKRRRRAAQQAQAFELELVEVEAIFEAWRAGNTSVGLRPDTDPMAVLGVRSRKPGEPRQGLGVAIVQAGKALFGA